ncbi:hypothetical protein [Rhodanobacter sp. DHG33]|uniref:hypothetical protein n=1 Tax=Rhodanobacter sp. DHG33 TaxID=2775921 RepID=UPI00177E90FC|nr:hypothetical protein [Rhodanobacter sp. DHG33]MBD8899697.1 hypothetical protein [Rhodanobacter sp. DHG33]
MHAQLKLSVNLPDDQHEQIELRVSTGESCDVVIALPVRQSAPAHVATEAEREQDDYVLGGYAGI